MAKSKLTEVSSFSLVIPVYNNEKTAIPQLRLCQKILSSILSDYEIIVCDDASSDNTFNLIGKTFGKNKRFILLRNKINQGIAKNIFSLYKKAKKEYVGLFSVDGDWNPNDLKKMINALQKNSADIVIGKRKTKNYSLKRKIISYSYNLIPKLLFGVTTYDAGSIKVFRKKVFESIPIKSRSVFFEAEFLIRAKKNGYRIISCPITFRRVDKDSGTGGQLKLVYASMRDVASLYFSEFLR